MSKGKISQVILTCYTSKPPIRYKCIIFAFRAKRTLNQSHCHSQGDTWKISHYKFFLSDQPIQCGVCVRRFRDCLSSLTEFGVVTLTLMVETDAVTETSDTNSTLNRLIAQEDFIVHCHRQSFKFYNKVLLSLYQAQFSVVNLPSFIRKERPTVLFQFIFSPPSHQMFETIRSDDKVGRTPACV
jgi:hypothetical protein